MHPQVKREIPVSQEYEESSCTFPWKWAQLDTSLKCLYTTAHSAGHNQEKLEVCMPFRAVISLGSWRAVATAHTVDVLMWMDTGC